MCCWAVAPGLVAVAVPILIAAAAPLLIPAAVPALIPATAAIPRPSFRRFVGIAPIGLRPKVPCILHTIYLVAQLCMFQPLAKNAARRVIGTLCSCRAQPV